MNIIITRLDSKSFKKHVQTSAPEHSYYQTDAGILKLMHTDKGIYSAEFCDEQPTKITTQIPEQLVLVGTDFQIAVWSAALQIPAGKTATYQEIEHKIGKPRAWRAVANALANNKIAYFIPCHRVVRTNGSLGGYKWGIERKQRLLKAEGD